ncbi:MAG: VOC family protein [Alphaproteobacteria bacterium]
MTIEHFGIAVRDMRKSLAFYTASLKPLGLKPTLGDGKSWQMFGDKAHSQFGIHPSSRPTPKIHFAFRAKSPRAVDEFYLAAIKAGAKDNGKPGPREDYGYAAFVIDPNGHNLEAVNFTAPKRRSKR